MARTPSSPELPAPSAGVVARDTAGRNRADATMGELNHDFVAFLENTSDFVYFKDANRRYRFCSQALATITGHANWREMIGKHDLDLFPEALAHIYGEEEIQVFLYGKALLDKVDPFFDAAGRPGWVSTNKWPLFDAERNVVGLFGISRDVTEHQRREQALRESGERVRRREAELSEAERIAHLGHWTLDVMRKTVVWSDEMKRIWQFDPADVGGSFERVIEQRVHPDDREWFTSEVASPRETGCATLEYRIVLPDASVRTLASLPGETVRSADGTILTLSGVTQDITERKLAEDALRQSAQEFWSLAEAIPQMVWVTQPEGANIYVNRQWVEYTGLTLEDSYGDGWTKPFHPDDKQRAWDAWQRATRSGDHLSLECRLRRGDGTYRWWLIRGAPLLGSSGEVLKWFGSCTDIDDLKQAERDLIDARNAADAANRVKTEFLANMSHEIRTPLNGILGYVQLLELEALSPEQREYLAAIATSGRNLSALINDIIDMSKIEADRITLEQVEFDLRGSLRLVVAMQRLRLTQKRLALQVNVADDVPATLVGDELRVKQIVANLLSNAVKFTEHGSITISATVRERREAVALVEIAVTDTGIGMSAAATNAIFEPFVQADTSITRRYGGSGLGLSICRRLADLMGGHIDVESKEGVGSTFRLMLPFALGAPAAEPAAVERTAGTATGVAGGSVRTCKVLLVEDNDVNQRFGMALLKTLGCVATLAANGEEALARLEHERFDVVLMDIQLPVMDGRKALRLLREREASSGRHTPVVALTAFALKGDAERFLQDGFDGYLSKPLQIQDLVATMTRIVEAPHTAQEEIRT